jgi:hypothetical protein
MPNHRSAPRPLNNKNIADAREQLKSLGGFGAGLGQLLETVAKLSEASNESREFSIGGPKSPLRGSYNMRVGSLSDITPQKRAKVSPRNTAHTASVPLAEGFVPSIFETVTGVMIVAETGAFGRDAIDVQVSIDGTVITLSTPDHSATASLPRAVDPNSLEVAVVNAILTVNAIWSA